MNGKNKSLRIALLSLIMLATALAMPVAQAYATLQVRRWPLIYSTDFEGVTVKDSEELNLPVSNYFSLNLGSFWVEDSANPTSGAPAAAHSGTHSIGLSTQASTSTSLRSEFELDYLQNLAGLGNELYVSVWLYLPTNWNLQISGYNWYEMINTFVCYPGTGGGYPRTTLVIIKPNGPNGPYTLKFEYNTGAGGGPILGQITNFQPPLGRWFNIKYYVYRDETNGKLMLWLDAPPTYNNVLVANATGYQTKYPGQTNWFTVIGKTYLDGDGYEHKIWVDDLQIYNTMPAF